MVEYPAQRRALLLAALALAAASACVAADTGLFLDGVPYVPLRATVAWLGGSVKWDPDARTALVTLPAAARGPVPNDVTYVDLTALRTVVRIAPGSAVATVLEPAWLFAADDDVPDGPALVPLPSAALQRDGVLYLPARALQTLFSVGVVPSIWDNVILLTHWRGGGDTIVSTVTVTSPAPADPTDPPAQGVP